MLSVCAFAQDNEPEMVLGAKEGGYEWFTPAEVVEAGGGSGGGPALSDADPAALGTAAPGTAATASRGDHAHPPTGLRQVPAIPANSVGQVLGVKSATEYEWGVVPEVPDPGGAGVQNGWIVTRTGSGRLDYAWAAPPGGGGSGVPSPAGAAAGSVLGTDGTAVGWVASSSSAPLALGTAAAGGSRHLARGDHVHPPTGLRQVPDPAHVADGHVLAVASGNYGWAAPGGGGSASGTSDWTLLGATTQLSGSGTRPLDSYGSGFSASSCHAALTGDTPWAAVRVSFNAGVQGVAWLGNFEFSGTTVNVWGPMAPGGGSSLWSWRLACTATGTAVDVWTNSGRFSSSGAGVKVWVLPTLGGGGGAAPLSDGAPLALGTAAAGTGTKGSRGDHVHPTTGIRQLPAIPNDAASKEYVLGTTSDGSAPVWTNDIHEALMDNAESIGSNTVNLAYLDTPGGTPSEPDATDGQVWTATDCKATNNNESWTCDGDWEEPVYTRRVLLASGQTGSNSGSVDNSTFNIYSLMQNAATAFNRFEFYIEDRNNASAANYHCLMAGVRPGGTLAVTGATNTFYGTMAGISSNVRCSLNVPTTGNTTFGWDDPGGSSNKHFWVYGVRTP